MIAWPELLLVAGLLTAVSTAFVIWLTRRTPPARPQPPYRYSPPPSYAPYPTYVPYRPATRSSATKWWVIFGLTLGAVVVGVYVLGFWLYLTHEHDQFFDPDLAARAEAVCRDAQEERASLPTLPPSPTFEERAQSVERSTVVFERMVERLRRLSPPGENEGFDRWIAAWEEFLSIGQPYADALRTGDEDVYVPAGNRGDRPASEFNTIARANGMDDCVF